MPLPVSLTKIRKSSATRPTPSSTRPPLGVNLIAFESRFQTTCCNLVASPKTIADSRIADCGFFSHPVAFFRNPQSAVRNPQLYAFGLGRGAHHVERVADHRGNVH